MNPGKLVGVVNVVGTGQTTHGKARHQLAGIDSQHVQAESGKHDAYTNKTASKIWTAVRHSETTALQRHS